eukprot:jgi/Chlat1/5942/Chrsp4S06262
MEVDQPPPPGQSPPHEQPPPPGLSVPMASPTPQPIFGAGIPLAPYGYTPVPYPGLPQPLLSHQYQYTPPVRTQFRPAARRYLTPVVKASPQTTVYVGKIGPRVDDQFMRSLLEKCGPVQSWKRVQDPETGKLKGFGFCEFSTAEGVLRALHVLKALAVDGQELLVNVNQATQKYVDEYIARKKAATEVGVAAQPEAEPARDVDSKMVEAEAVPVEDAEKHALAASSDSTQAADNLQSTAAEEATTTDITAEAATSEPKEAAKTDEEQIAELRTEVFQMVEEWENSLPPPEEIGVDEVADIARASREKLEQDFFKEQKPEPGGSEGVVTPETRHSEGNHSREREPSRDRERTRDRPRDISHDRNRAVRDDQGRARERRDTDGEHKATDQHEAKGEKAQAEPPPEPKTRRERQRDMELEYMERMYKDRERQWEAREYDKEREREYYQRREKELDWERQQEIETENEADDNHRYRYKMRRESYFVEIRKRRQREREEDELDRLKELEEMAAKRLRAAREAALPPPEVLKEVIAPRLTGLPETRVNGDAVDHSETSDPSARQSEAGQQFARPISEKRSDPGAQAVYAALAAVAEAEARKAAEEAEAAAAERKKLELRIAAGGGGGKRPFKSVFGVDEEDPEQEARRRVLEKNRKDLEDILKDQREVAAATLVHPKVPEPEDNKVRSKDKERHSKHRDESRHGKSKDRSDKHKENGKDVDFKPKDVKALIDSLPTKRDELFVFPIDWAVFEQAKVADKLQPWVNAKVKDFLGQEEADLVKFIVGKVEAHIAPESLLTEIAAVFDEEAEMFLLKLWRTLLFEVQKAKFGL